MNLLIISIFRILLLTVKHQQTSMETQAILVTMCMLVHTFVNLDSFGVTASNSGDINVALGSSCSASSVFRNQSKYLCEKAFDGETETKYGSMAQGVGLWLELHLQRSYVVNKLRIMDRYDKVEKNKDIRLTFSNGSTQQIQLPEHESGLFWTNVSIKPVLTNSIMIEVITVYTTNNNGFIEIQVFEAKCDVNAKCARTGSDCSCTCVRGFRGDGFNCTDVDECAVNTDSCDENDGCENPREPFNCTCIPGFSGDGFTCTDVDECELKNDSCHLNAMCVNTPGSFNCTCFPGFNGNGFKCIDVNECVLKGHNCDVNAGCVNTPGSFYCTCFPGFTGDGLNCTDVDECESKNDSCHLNAICVNTPGSVNCTCLSGFNGDGFRCIDVNECLLKADNCDVNAGCVNTPGSFNCTCFHGFTGDGLNCIDVDECELKNDSCHLNATCVNTPGSFNCTCLPGFIGDGLRCIDVTNQTQCCCPTPKNLTKEESKAFMDEILESLTINKTKASAYRRKYTSAHDGRVSAQSFGYGGTAIFVIVFGGIFLSDLPRLLTDFRNLIHNLRNIFR